ncbi:cellular tumor antigen p53-like [Tropilaelaps mercedesae]|uniref:Cellular tumor antigen p53-like n=1 Tax=Tropilaelaps mercedesae TaxID=418985 RepID=A0A1V9Y190_9ACAR|nr:cellular tumor antigen p53-like [Tropilaelaps mercedesae]
MEGGSSESIPNSQEIIDMMLQMPEQSSANYISNEDRRLTGPLISGNNGSVANTNASNNSNTSNQANGNHTGSMTYYNVPDSRTPFLQDEEYEQELQTFAENLLMAPTPPPVTTHPSAPHYQDVKPVINQQEWLHANLNSTIVNQALSDNQGDYGFRVFFDSHEKVTKNMTWTFSAEVGRLYVMLNSQCPFKIGTTHAPPDDAYIVVVPVYKDAVSRSENVVRCPHHCRNLDASGLKGKFWMNSPHPQAIYHEDVQNSNRHCLVVPFEKPHTGCPSYTYLFEFMCRNTCLGGVNRRATEVVFLLQHQGKELARAVVEVKVCACPGRDRRTDEASLAKRLSMETSGGARAVHRGGAQHSNTAGSGLSGHTRLKFTPVAAQDSSALGVVGTTDNEHETGPDGEQLFTIRVRGRANFEILKRVAEGLELRAQHQRVKKRKLTNGSSVSGTVMLPGEQQRSNVQHQQQAITMSEVRREGDIVYSDG